MGFYKIKEEKEEAELNKSNVDRKVFSLTPDCTASFVAARKEEPESEHCKAKMPLTTHFSPTSLKIDECSQTTFKCHNLIFQLSANPCNIASDPTTTAYSLDLNKR